MAGLLEQNSNKNRKKVVSKNTSGQSREYAALTRNHLNHKHWALRRENVTFSAVHVVKSISSMRREMHYGLG